ncbi:hypothetical protein [Sphingobacterium bovisgrunnientis]|jgi:CTP:phosphocholine cytidylyltransferase-like protein|uniref:hypothetical protein n=1 Tax=Sphingobacterium bovisgrunnientis TaxID=1874697 RepID=UPI0013599FB9|nr:hypothetical protein [Sphingobacterium bovisgrunnientis]
MEKTFNIEEALNYCEDKNVNMLFTETNYLEENAVFKLYKVKEELLIGIMINSHNEEIRKTIIPSELSKRAYDLVILDTSSIIIL